MLRDRDIIIFGDDWGRYPSTIQHIARVLITNNRILWVGSIGLRRPHLRLSDIRRVWEKGSRMFSRPQERREKGPVCLHPFVIPLHDNKLFHRLTMASIKITVRQSMASLNISRPILLTSSPWVGEVIGDFGESSSHYLCLDDNTLFDDVFTSAYSAEQILIRRADSCFFVSEILRAKYGRESQNSYFLPQGVNFAHFSRSTTQVDIPGVPKNKPIIGFFGLLAAWVDLELIKKCARSYPHAIFVIIGKAAVDVSLLKSESNIIYLGEIPYERLPEYVGRFNVGLIPFSVNELTIAANPLKLMEYMASGTAVVSTNLPEVARFKPVVHVAKNDEEFIRLVGIALEENSNDKQKLRQAKAAEYSWESIVERISTIIEDIEARKSASRNPSEIRTLRPKNVS